MPGSGLPQPEVRGCRRAIDVVMRRATRPDHGRRSTSRSGRARALGASRCRWPINEANERSMPEACVPSCLGRPRPSAARWGRLCATSHRARGHRTRVGTGAACRSRPRDAARTVPAGEARADWPRDSGDSKLVEWIMVPAGGRTTSWHGTSSQAGRLTPRAAEGGVSRRGPHANRQLS